MVLFLGFLLFGSQFLLLVGFSRLLHFDVSILIKNSEVVNSNTGKGRKRVQGVFRCGFADCVTCSSCASRRTVVHFRLKFDEFFLLNVFVYL